MNHAIRSVIRFFEIMEELRQHEVTFYENDDIEKVHQALETKSPKAYAHVHKKIEEMVGKSCPCGSGNKFENCCLAANEGQTLH